MAATRDRILSTAREQFFTLGFSKVTMDEISHELAISKRTLYQHFPTKKALLREALVGKAVAIAQGLAAIASDEENSVSNKLNRGLALVANEMPRFSPAFLRDIQRKAPEIWEELDRQRQKTIQTHFAHLIEEGTREGVLRDDVDPQLLVLVFSTLVQHIINPQTLSQLPLSNTQAFALISGVVFQGILTERGRAHYRLMEP